MDGGTGVRRHFPGRPLTRWAALPLALLALAALPLAAAGPGPVPFDTEGPSVIGLAVNSNPVVPDPVIVSAIAIDNASAIANAELFVDMPGLDGSSFFRMRPDDFAWDATMETVLWVGPYSTFSLGLAPGPHLLFVHAMDGFGNWGPYATLAVYLGDPSTTGPGVVSLAVSPADLSLGGALTVEATVFDPFKGIVEAAEMFLDVPGPDGTGIRMAARDGAFDTPAEAVTRSEVPDLPAGEHGVYVHGMARGLWGAPVAGTFLVRAPAFALRLVADTSTPGPEDLVTYAVEFENRGNENATSVTIDLILPIGMAYVDDTVVDAQGVRLAGTTYGFMDVPPGPRSFTVRAQVAASATDALPLDAAAILTFTNLGGHAFLPVSANVAGTVVAPELAITLRGPAEAFPGETALLSIRIEHTGVRTIPAVDLTLAPSPWTTILFDTAASAGGVARGTGVWRFANLAPGAHGFDVTLAIAAEVADGQRVTHAITASYSSRLGAPAATASETAFTAVRPAFTAILGPDRTSVTRGDRITLRFEYTNVGSVAAETVRVGVTLPSSLALVGGDPPSWSAGDRHAWLRTDVGPGADHVSVVVEARMSGPIAVAFDLVYTSPNGAELGRVAASAELTVGKPPPSPAPLVVGVSVTAASLGLAAAAATERGKTALLFTFVPLYSRLQKEKILDHETRGMIRGYILANPGDHYNSIKEALELPNGTLAYHIQVLEKEMLVRSVKDGKFRRFYPFDMRMPEGGEPTKIQRVVLDLIRANPGITPRDAAALLGLTSSTVSYHLERLAGLARIEYRREGISKRLYVKGDLVL